MTVLGSVVTLIVLSIVLIGISGRMNSFNLGQSEIVFAKAEGCLEEGLIQLSRNPDYLGNTYTVDDSTCTVAVSGSADERTLGVDVFEEDFYHHLIVDVRIAPSFAILDFSY